MKNKTIDLKNNDDKKNRLRKKEFRKCPKCGKPAICHGFMSLGSSTRFVKKYKCLSCDHTTHDRQGCRA
jgi:ribosomal protein L37AE/L43A